MIFKKLLLLFFLTAIVPLPVNAGTVTLENLAVQDYFSSHEGRWSGNIMAKSTVQWPNWMQYQGFVVFDDVLESGLMAYRCNSAVSGGCTISDPDVHRFMFTGPATPAYPLLGDAVKITDKVVGGEFRRTWTIRSAEDAIQTVAHFPFAEFTPPSEGTPLLPIGYTLTFHMADVDTIGAMLAGSFGSPLAHRSSQPCTGLRVVNNKVFSTQCNK